MLKFAKKWLTKLRGLLFLGSIQDEKDPSAPLSKKYQENLTIPLITVLVAGVAKTIVPSRTNNCLESFFRLIKSSLRRNTGRSGLTKEFSSVGALLPYYISMKNHKTFKTIFENEDKLIEEFAAINKDKRNMPCNIVNIGRKLSDNSEIFHENLAATG